MTTEDTQRPMRAIQVRLPQHDYDRLADLAEEKAVPVAVLARMLLVNGIGRLWRLERDAEPGG